MFVWGLLKRSRTDLEEWNRGVWGGDRNGVEAWRFCHEGWEGNKCLGDGKDLLLLLQLSTMLLLLLRLNCSSHSLAAQHKLPSDFLRTKVMLIATAPVALCAVYCIVYISIISFFMQCIVYVWILSWSIIINWYIIYTYNKENTWE